MTNRSTARNQPLLDTALEVIPSGFLVNPHAIAEPAHLKDTSGRDAASLDPGHAFPFQLLVRALDRPVSGSEPREGEDDDPEAHFARFVHGDERAVAVLDDVEEQGPRRELFDCLRRLLFAAEAFEQADVGAEGAGGVQAGDALFVAELLEGVGAGDEDDVGARVVDGGSGGADAGEVDVGGDDFLAGEVAAAFGEDLVFEVEAGDVGADVLLDG